MAERSYFETPPRVGTQPPADNSELAASTEYVDDAVAGGGGVPAAHAASHEDGGSDELDVTALGGFPGGSTNFLREDGTFAPAGATAPTAPAGTPNVWFSADDAGITVDGSNQPTLIPNQGSDGGNFVLDATATKRGVIEAAVQNGLPCLQISADDYLRYTFPAAMATAQWQVFIAMRRGAPGASDPRIFSLPVTGSANDTDGTNRTCVLFYGAGTTVNQYRNSAVPCSFTWDVPMSYYTPTIVEWGSDGTDYQFGRNGLLHRSDPAGSTANVALASTDLLVGAGWFGSAISGWMAARIFEVLFYYGASSLDVAEADQTRRYLAAKWAIPIMSAA